MKTIRNVDRDIDIQALKDNPSLHFQLLKYLALDGMADPTVRDAIEMKSHTIETNNRRIDALLTPEILQKIFQDQAFVEKNLSNTPVIKQYANNITDEYIMSLPQFVIEYDRSLRAAERSHREEIIKLSSLQSAKKELIELFTGEKKILEDYFSYLYPENVGKSYSEIHDIYYKSFKDYMMKKFYDYAIVRKEDVMLQNFLQEQVNKFWYAHPKLKKIKLVKHNVENCINKMNSLELLDRFWSQNVFAIVDEGDEKQKKQQKKQQQKDYEKNV